MYRTRERDVAGPVHFRFSLILTPHKCAKIFSNDLRLFPRVFQSRQILEATIDYSPTSRNYKPQEKKNAPVCGQIRAKKKKKMASRLKCLTSHSRQSAHSPNGMTSAHNASLAKHSDLHLYNAPEKGATFIGTFTYCDEQTKSAPSCILHAVCMYVLLFDGHCALLNWRPRLALPAAHTCAQRDKKRAREIENNEELGRRCSFRPLLPRIDPK